ncbi:hypothetical protein KI387_007517 [Taxus chinensis]|uniref:Pentatricopeptide repeat-containing protein n=1 Tax=Taxus chinensis TaxID=29808 RepID=A0AA38GPP5_TAXCH|nr:hypothetical protein KI387_007517 [Taxus chinensis]
MSSSSFHAAFPLSGPLEPYSHQCYGCADVQAGQTLSKTLAQNYKNLWQKTMPVWSLRPDFGVPHRNYASRAVPSDLVSAEGMSVSHLDKSYSESGEDEEDEAIEKKQGNYLEVCEQFGSERSVDFGEVGRVFKVVEELFAMDRNMDAVLDQCGVNLSHSLVYHVLSRFSNARKPALRFFNWAGRQEGFSHNSLTYNMMMNILGRTKQFESMCELLEEMGKKKSVLTTETFEIAIKACAAGREMKKAVQIFTLMERYKFRVNINNFNFLLDALGRAKLAKEAQMLFERMRDKFPPDAKTYTVLLSGWCKVKNLIQAGKIWNDMLDEGFKPDLVTHNIMLEGLFMGKRKDDALKLFGLMKGNGPSPNTRSYTIVICALCKLHRMGEAQNFFVEMQEIDCPIDAAVYTCLITGYGNAKNLDQAYKLLLEMKERGISHDCQTYNALIKVTVDMYKPDEAAKLYEEMIQRDFKPTIHTYNMLMKLYFSTRKPERGFDIWNQMARNGCSPDVNSYTVFIGGLIREGRSQEACNYIEKMIDKGMRVPRFDNDKFIADCSRAGRPDIFEHPAEKMKQTGRLDVADVFIKYSQKMEKRAKKTKRRHVTPVGLWSSGEFGRLPRRQPRF